MASFLEIKKDIDFYKGLSAILKALKSIAISQFNIFEKKVKPLEKFSQCVEGFLGGIDLQPLHHPFLQPKNTNLGIIAVTSDTGLLGGLNRSIMNTAFNELSKDEGVLIVLGERGKIYAREAGIRYTGFEGIVEQRILEQAIALRNYIIKGVSEGTFGRVKIIYAKAYSLIVQRVEKHNLLPYGEQQTGKKLQLDEFILESSLDKVVEYLVYSWLAKKIYDIFNSSKLAEFAARFSHLEECVHKIEELEEKLKFKYFRQKHEFTDKGIRELFAARSLYAHK